GCFSGSGFMVLRLVVPVLCLPLLAGCDVTAVDGGSADAQAQARANAALARTCISTTAASLKLDRSTLSAVGVRSLPEGDEVTVRLSPAEVARCYTDLSGKVI